MMMPKKAKRESDRNRGKTRTDEQMAIHLLESIRMCDKPGPTTTFLTRYFQT